MRNRFWLAAGLAAAVVAGAMAPRSAEASTIPYGVPIQGNDCAGVLGSPFENCALNGSPIIAKFNTGASGGWQFNTSVFPTIDGSEFAFTPSAPGPSSTSGFFTYTPGPGDPDLTGWVVKAGNQFVAFQYTGPQGVSTAWSTALLGNRGLSHISFYDTRRTVVPEPATLALLGIGLLGLAAAARRRRTA